MKKILINGLYPYDEMLTLKLIDYEKGRIIKEEVEKEFNKNFEKLWEIQEDFEYKSDGLLNWQDLLRPFSEIIENCKVLGLKRYFETNFFFRILWFNSRIDIKENQIDEWINKYFRTKYPNENKLIILPSPLLFHYFSENIDINTICDILLQITNFILEKRKGIILFEEPVLTKINLDENLKKILHSFYEKLCKKGYKIFLQCYFGNIENHLNFLYTLPIDGIGIDFINTEIDIIKKWDNNKILIAGCIDCENSYIESLEELTNFINILKGYVNNFYLSGSCDFIFLPSKIAEEKINNLKKLNL